jgi:hypothetical protein
MTSTTAQASLSLADHAVAPGADLPVYPAGTFENDRQPTLVEWQNGLQVARGALTSLPGILADVLQSALGACDDALVDRLGRREVEPHDRLHLFDTDARLTRKVVDALLKGLDGLAALVPGLEIKRRACKRWADVFIWIPEVGEVHVTDLSGKKVYASFRLFKSDALLPHFKDDAPVYELPEQIWSAAICCGALCESNDGVASVRAVTYEGRMYAITGGLFSREHSEAVAWLLVPREVWAGPTFTYESAVASFQDGSRQRGDERGLVVSVRGKQFVLSSYATFEDTRAPEVRNAAVYGSRDADEDGGQGLDDEEGEVGEAVASPAAPVDQMALF